MACSFFFLIVAYLYFPYVLSHSKESIQLTHTRETKRKTLEEVAAAFGDRVVHADEAPKRASVAGDVDHVESAVPKEP